MNAHTPTPYASTSAIEQDDGSFEAVVYSATDRLDPSVGPTVCVVRCRGQENAEADARFIADACNAYDA